MTKDSTSKNNENKNKALHRELDIAKHKAKANKLNEEAKEHGGQEGPDPTRYGDWEKGGRCTDF